jgi:hypothetical protein
VTHGIEDDEEISQFFAQSRESIGEGISRVSSPELIKKASRMRDSFEFVLKSTEFEEGARASE